MFKLKQWIPAICIMVVIFMFSATPSNDLPDYGIWDTLLKKAGHMTGYGLLSVAYWYGFKFEKKRTWQVWLLAILYAMSDEYHQMFTPGRHPSLVDVFLFDGSGAASGLLVMMARFSIGKKNISEGKNMHQEDHSNSNSNSSSESQSSDR